MARSLFVFLVWLVVLTGLLCSAQARERVGVVINEVFYDPAAGGDSGLEWVELYNNSPEPVVVGGWQLRMADYYEFTPASREIAPYSYLVVHNNADGVDTETEVYTGEAGFGNMSDSHGSVVLFTGPQHTVDTIVDFVQYGAGGQTWESLAVNAGIWTEGDFVPLVGGAGFSMGLDPNGVDNDSSADWSSCVPSLLAANCQLSPTATPWLSPTPLRTPEPTAPPGTPGATRTPVTPRPTPPPASGLRINEVLFNDEGAEDRNFIEILGPGGASLQGFRLECIKAGSPDCETYRTIDLGEYVIPGDGYLVLAQSETVPNYDATGAAFNFYNGPNGILLVGPGGVVDAFCYGELDCPDCEGTPVELQPESDDQSWSRFPDGRDTDDNAADFLWMAYSPGGPNVMPTPPPTPPPMEPFVWINELSYNDLGVDDRSYVELYGQPGQSLNGVFLVGLNGGTGGVEEPTIDFIFDLTGEVINERGFFLLSQSYEAGGDYIDRLEPDFSPQNGPDFILLRYGDPENGPILDCLAYGEFAGDPGFCEWPAPPDVEADDYALGRCPDGRDTDRNARDFKVIRSSPGLSNEPCPPTPVASPTPLGSPTPTCVPAPTWTPTPTPRLQPLDKLIITEILANTLDEEHCDAVEVFNLSSQPFRLAGLYVADGSGIDADLIYPHERDGLEEIPPLSFGVIVEDDFAGEYEIPEVEEGCVLFRIDDASMANGGLTREEPVLITEDPETTHIVAGFYGSRWLPYAGQSVERADFYGADDNPDNWRPSWCPTNILGERHSLGRHTCRPAQVPEGQLIVTEVQVVSGDDPCEIEFVELLNIGNEPIAMDQLYLYDGDAFDRLVPLRHCDYPLLAPGQIGLILQGDYFARARPEYRDTICDHTLLLTVFDQNGLLGGGSEGLAMNEPIVIFNADWRTRAATCLFQPSREACQSVERIRIDQPDTPHNWVPATCERLSGRHSAGRPNCSSPPLPGRAPRILLAGFDTTDLTAYQPGVFQVHALVEPGAADEEARVVRVELLYGRRVVAELPSMGNGYYRAEFPIPAGALQPTNLPLEFQLRAVDASGRESLLWPLLTVRGPETGCPDPADYGFSAAPPSPDSLFQAQGRTARSRAHKAQRPLISAAGFWDTALDAVVPRTLTIIAYAIPADASPITSVEVYYEGLPTGVMLLDDGRGPDWASGDGLFSFSTVIDPRELGLEPGEFRLQLVAHDALGRSSDPWPQVVIHEP
jgi:hypothetical protein